MKWLQGLAAILIEKLITGAIKSFREWLKKKRTESSDKKAAKKLKEAKSEDEINDAFDSLP